MIACRLHYPLAEKACSKGTRRDKQCCDGYKYFKNYYWYGERSDGAKIVFFLGNAISTGGLSWKTNNQGESESSITLTGNYTANNQDTAPFWMQEIEPAPTGV